ncbi:maltose ABC transporter permease MalG [Corallincola platygyrae]
MLALLILFPFFVLVYVSIRYQNYVPTERIGNLWNPLPIWEHVYSLNHWQMAFGMEFVEPDGRITPPPFPLGTWIWNGLKVGLLSSLLISLIAFGSAFSLTQLKSKYRHALLGTMVAVGALSVTPFIPGLYLLFEKFEQALPLIGLNSHLGLMVSYLPLSLPLAALTYWIGRRKLIEATGLFNAGVKMKWELVILFIASFILCFSESPLASLLLQDVDLLTPMVGLQQYLYPCNYLWGDFAAAALITTVLYALPLITLLVMVDRWIRTKGNRAAE